MNLQIYSQFLIRFACVLVLCLVLVVTDEICNKSVECGKGTCKSSMDFTFGFACECDQGWSQFSDKFRYLPCVVPNCTMNYSCSHPGEPPATAPEPPSNHSIFDPCSWSYCGHGTCVKTSTFSHRCDCKTGYANLLNITNLPCLAECSLGGNCARLGIGLSNSTGSTPPSTSVSSQSNSAYSIHTLKLGLPETSWLIMPLLSLAMVIY
ncbi:hypothetical protein QJS04_geneDACA007510 [Acorus gramineus]|uniref:EGF-like domain-containing protein n=1 Tax=Acorus gramineus TaxID=55184 RepID=A0AAV9B610_ACOGR|nr:hypothetical protein QJS04_geneDACA007510 [Acorus gramineus]